MAPTIGQIAAVSYNAVLAEGRTPANQWESSGFLHELDRQGGIVHKSLGNQIEFPLDYRRNPGTAIQSTDLQAVVTTKTEVITSALFDIAEVTVPVTWSKKDEVQTPSENAKVAFVKSLLLNGFASHDDILETTFFASATTNGFIPLAVHIVDAGTGSDGGIDSSTETWWRNQQATYIDDTDIEAAFTSVWNSTTKSSGDKAQPSLMASDAATQSTFEGTQQPLQRYETQEMKAGFKTLMFKTARYVFSQYGTTDVYFMKPGKSFSLVVSKEYFRDRGDTQELENANGWRFKIYSACQTGTGVRSRLGVAHV